MGEEAAETAPWAAQADADDPLYRAQLRRLYDRSAFYRDKLAAAGFPDSDSAGGLDAIAALPLTEKDELRASRTPDNPIGSHLAAPMAEIARIYSTSGTTGAPSFIPLTAADIADWITISSRSYGAAGIVPGMRIVSTYGAGPFVAGVALEAFAALGLCHIPVGAGNTDRLRAVIASLKPQIVALTPSYALYMAEAVPDLAASSVKHLLVAGEPGGGEPALRSQLEAAWGAQVTEVMGIGDIAVSLWGECPARDGMHFSGRGLVHVEMIDPTTGALVPMEDGATGELVYTHLRHRAAPLLRFRSRDHVVVRTRPCGCGRTAPRVRCIGRTDDMLILRGVNVFPSALREVVAEFAPAVSGVIAVRPKTRSVKQTPPLPLVVELAEGAHAGTGLAERIERRIRATLIATTVVELVPFGALPRSDYKSKLVDWSGATDAPA